MKAIALQKQELIRDISWLRLKKRSMGIIGIALLIGLALFIGAGPILRLLDPTAAVLDIGSLSLLLFGLLILLFAVCCSTWLLGSLWKVLHTFHKEFDVHFNELSPWQKCIIYFSVLFLLLYACLWAMSIAL